MASRWKVLILVGLAVALLDQWTKFLVVRNLTPGIAQAQHDSKRPFSKSQIDDAVASTSITQQIGYFYGNIKKPCQGLGARCRTVKVIDGFWNWRYVENPGAAWGLMSGVSDSIRVPFFLLISVAAIGFIIMFFRKLEDSQYLLVSSLSLVFGGAIGNFIDRLHLSYVIDFIDWYVGTSHWPTFNVADAAISSGVALLCIEWIRDVRKQQAEAKVDEPESTAKSAS